MDIMMEVLAIRALRRPLAVEPTLLVQVERTVTVPVGRSAMRTILVMGAVLGEL